MRYDQFMKFGWKGLVPISLVWILLVAAIRTATLEVENRRTLLLVVGAVFLVVLAVFYLLPQPEPDQQSQEGSGLDLVPLDQGGFPTPPLDLVVPATPRSLVTAGAQPVLGTVPSDKPASENPDGTDRG
jgi:NADH-quinone oxidoreductase subunit H